jgi:DNA-binding MarR family transcriptional regulator
MEVPTVVLLRLARDLLSAEVGAEVRRVAPDQRPTHGSVMEQLDFEDGLRLTDLARGAGMTPQAIGELVDQLEALGYVERRPDPDDRRAKRIYRTARARRASEAAFETAHRIDAELDELLGPDRLPGLKADLVRIVESRGGEITHLPAAPKARSRTAR